jgi:hypothetical protein
VTNQKGQRLETATTTVQIKCRGACPSYFRCCCSTAQQGGDNSYYNAGHELMRHVAQELDYSYDQAEIESCVDALGDLLKAEDDEGVLAWFDRELPRCMKFVPRRRRGQFLQGVYAMFEEDGFLVRL